MSYDALIAAFVCQKGGGGKTTGSTNLLVCALKGGVRSVIVDLDPQGSSFEWGRIRSAGTPDSEPPLVIACTSDQLDRILASLIEAGTELVILDTAGTMGPDVDAAIAASDVVLIPVAPSVCDLKACLPTVRAVRQMKKPFAFVLNSCSTGHQRISEAAAVLSKLAVLAGEPVHRRTVYQDAYAKGLGVVELSDPKAIHEVDALWQWLKGKRNSMNEER